MTVFKNENDRSSKNRPSWKEPKWPFFVGGPKITVLFGPKWPFFNQNDRSFVPNWPFFYTKMTVLAGTVNLVYQNGHFSNTKMTVLLYENDRSYIPKWPFHWKKFQFFQNDRSRWTKMTVPIYENDRSYDQIDRSYEWTKMTVLNAQNDRSYIPKWPSHLIFPYELNWAFLYTKMTVLIYQNGSGTRIRDGLGEKYKQSP